MGWKRAIWLGSAEQLHRANTDTGLQTTNVRGRQPTVSV